MVYGNVIVESSTVNDNSENKLP